MNHHTLFQDYIIHNAGYSRLSKPIIKSANGSFLVSACGEKYFDPSLGAGSQIFGHANNKVIGAVKKQIEEGSIYLWNNSEVHSFCRSLQDALPNGQSHYVFCNSGSEATQRQRAESEAQDCAYRIREGVGAGAPVTRRETIAGLSHGSLPDQLRTYVRTYVLPEVVVLLVLLVGA